MTFCKQHPGWAKKRHVAYKSVYMVIWGVPYIPLTCYWYQNQWSRIIGLNIHLCFVFYLVNKLFLYETTFFLTSQTFSICFRSHGCLIIKSSTVNWSLEFSNLGNIFWVHWPIWTSSQGKKTSRWVDNAE